jgi:nitrogenase molybdenum-iron protein NifN
LIGDLEDLEQRAAGADLIITHSHGRQASERLGVPLFRLGLPTFDRLGAAQEVSVGYRGTRNLIFAIGNIFIARTHEPDEETWRQDFQDHAHAGAAAQSNQLVQIETIV